MSKKVTTIIFLLGVILLVGGGCLEEKKRAEDFVQKENDIEIEEEVISNVFEEDALEEDLSMTAKEENEETRRKQKDCDRYNWPFMNEGPYRDKISYALSNDLVNWTDSEKVLAEHASVPGAVVKDNIIYVYYVDVEEECYPEQLKMIKSSDDGQTWSGPISIYIEGLGEKVAVDPAPYLLDDGRIRLFYFDINGDKNPRADFKIYSAISNDNVNFKEEEGVRFSNPGTLDPDVIRVGNTWRLYTGDIQNIFTISAVSSDGLNFSYEGVAYSDGVVPDVFYKDGLYYLYTAGIDIATSENGANFTKIDGRFQSKIGIVTADPSVVELSDGTYLMMYKTNEGKIY